MPRPCACYDPVVWDRWPVPSSAIAPCLLLALIPASCGSESRPPPLADWPGAQLDAAQVLDVSAPGTPAVPTCNLGPGGGACACADQPLVMDPPNIYLVLDRSGSMGQGAPTKWQSITQVLHGLVVSLGPRAKIGAAVFPAVVDVTGCDPGGEVFAPVQGDAPAGSPGPIAYALRQILAGLAPAGGTPTAATLRLLTPYLRSLPGKTYVILATDGGPNCNPAATCDVTMCQPNIEGTVGCPVAGPNCCAGDGGALASPNSCLDADPTVAAVRALAQPGDAGDAAAPIPVYVLGIPGSEPYAKLLDRLALAGTTARAAGQDAGGGPQYYSVSSTDQAPLGAALGAIAARITGTCTLTLNATPPDPALVNVFLDEQPVPQQTDFGPNWTLDGTTVTLLGAACQRILEGAVLDVRVVAGCPTVVR